MTTAPTSYSTLLVVGSKLELPAHYNTTLRRAGNARPIPRPRCASVLSANALVHATTRVLVSANQVHFVYSDGACWMETELQLLVLTLPAPSEWTEQQCT